jgi:hypothetical protein
MNRYALSFFLIDRLTTRLSTGSIPQSGNYLTKWAFYNP